MYARSGFFFFLICIHRIIFLYNTSHISLGKPVSNDADLMSFRLRPRRNPSTPWVVMSKNDITKKKSCVPTYVCMKRKLKNNKACLFGFF